MFIHGYEYKCQICCHPIGAGKILWYKLIILESVQKQIFKKETRQKLDSC